MASIKMTTTLIVTGKRDDDVIMMKTEERLRNLVGVLFLFLFLTRSRGNFYQRIRVTIYRNVFGKRSSRDDTTTTIRPLLSWQDQISKIKLHLLNYLVLHYFL